MEEQIATLVKGLQSAVTTLAPEAWKALVFAARVDGLLSIGFGVLMLFVTAVWLYYFNRMWKWAAHDYNEPGIVIASVFIGIAFILGLVALFSTSTWLGVFYPEAEVVRELLSKVGK